MSVQILYFAGLRESLGVASESLALPESVRTLGELRDWLVQSGRTALGHTRNLRAAVNQDMAGMEATVKDGDEIAFFPPVTGG